MKFLILSDLPLEFAGYSPPAGSLREADAVILAGDIMPNVRKLAAWAARPSVFGAERPIIVVAGNHEYYGGRLEARRHELREASRQHPNVHVLDPGELLLDDGRLRVLGCTLWSNFELAVKTPTGEISDRARAMSTAGERMNDYRRISVEVPADELQTVKRGRRSSGVRRFSPDDALKLHRAERAWLLDKLSEPFDGRTLVVTHHGPSAESVAPRWESDWLSPAFSSHLPEQFFWLSALWVHSHTHDSRDYQRGSTHVVCNPRGYLLHSGRFEMKPLTPAWWWNFDVAPNVAASGEGHASG